MPAGSRSKARPSPSRSPPPTTAPPRASWAARARQPRSPTPTGSPPRHRSSPNKTAGSFTATATALGAQPGRYTLENLAAAPTSITAGAADGQSTAVGARFPIPLAVTVTDKNGNPVAGATVTFAAPAKGASGRFTQRAHVSSDRIVRVRTNSKGIAVAPPFTANASVGGYAVTATVKGSSVRTAFSLLNLPRG